MTDIIIILWIDDFRGKYKKKADVEQLHDMLGKWNKLSVDWECKKYCGLTLYWNYGNPKDIRWMNISMPGQIMKCLLKFSHQKLA